MSRKGSPDSGVSLKNKISYGLDLDILKGWSKEREQMELSRERAKQEIAVAKVRAFMDALLMIIRIQSWWRMVQVRMWYLNKVSGKRISKFLHFNAWKVYRKVEKSYLNKSVGQYFHAWHDDIIDEKRLNTIVKEFFKLSIKRLRLTPQAIMAYFNPIAFVNDVAHTDMMKIRRLMLEKLFIGWKHEVRVLKLCSYKASQVLSRMVRRTKGPLWVKESSLVCFHLWYRYTAVKRAYRYELPDPRFTVPYLPQWAILVREITMSRVKKKRTVEKGHKLTQLRMWKKWVRLMAVDRTKAVTPLAVAISHYNNVLLARIVGLWKGVVLDRGRMMRYKDRIFYRWKTWTPMFKKLNSVSRSALEWIRFRRLRKSYDVMIKMCLGVIDKRTHSLKEMRKNFCDRKIIVCAYALLNKNEHVIMIDCWRRLTYYWKSRRMWKALAFQYKSNYHTIKIKLIFNAWKGFTQTAKNSFLLDSSPPPSRPITPGVNNTNASRPATPLTQVELLRDVPFMVYKLILNGMDRKLPTKLNETQLFLFSTAICQSYSKLKRDEKSKGDDNSKVNEHYDSNLQQKLQTAIDNIDLNTAIEAVKEGAVVETQFIRELSLHIGDQYTALFSYLLSRSPLYLVERFIRKDLSVSVNNCQHPMNAVLLSTQLERWCHKKNLTCRETSCITEAKTILHSFGTQFEGIYMVRTIVLLLIDRKIRQAVGKCVMLPETRTVDEEVVEVMKRKKIERLQTIRRSLTILIGLPVNADPIEGIQYYYDVEVPPLLKSKNGIHMEDLSSDENKSSRSIYTVLLEFNVLTGRLANEARAIRSPLMERDKKLLFNGFMKQSRSDFLSLRRQCMTPAQLKAEQDEKLKQEAKEQKKFEKELGIGSPKKKKRKSSGKKKKGKGKGDKSENDDSNNEEENIDMNLDSGPGLELYREMEFVEEITVKNEYDFHHRVKTFKHLFTETWLPVYNKKYEKNKYYSTRSQDEVKSVLKRLLDYLRKDKNITNVDILSCQNQNGGIGLWLISLGLTDAKFKSSKIWSVLPKDWWNGNTIKNRINQEQVVVDALITSLSSSIEKTQINSDVIEKDMSLYKKFLKKARTEIMDISMKRRDKRSQDLVQRAPKLFQVKKSSKKIIQFTNEIKSIKDKLSICEIMIATGNLEGAYNILGSSSDEAIDQKKSSVINYAKAVYAMIEEKKKEITLIEEKITTFEEKKLLSEEELRQFDKQTIKTTKMLKDLAESKFNTIVDIQLLLSRAGKSVKDSKIDKVMTSRLKKFLSKYSMILKAFTSDKITKKRAPIVRSNDNGHSLKDSDDFKSHGPLLNIDSADYTQEYDNMTDQLHDEPIPTVNKDNNDDDMFQNDDVLLDLDNESLDDTEYTLNTEDEINAKALSVDEVISLAHYNSDFNRLKREEEARLLEEAQRLAVDENNLRMQIFENYWSVLPPLDEDTPQTIFNKKVKKEEPKDIVEEEQQEPQMEQDDENAVTAVQSPSKKKKVELNKTTKMWAAIGKNHSKRYNYNNKKKVEEEGDEPQYDSRGQARFSAMFEKDKLGNDEDYFDISGSNDIKVEKHYEKLPKDYVEVGDKIWKQTTDDPLNQSVSMKPDKIVIEENTDENEGQEDSIASQSNGSGTSSRNQSGWKNDPFMLVGLQQYPRLKAGLLHSSIYNKRKVKAIIHQDTESHSSESEGSKKELETENIIKDDISHHSIDQNNLDEIDNYDPDDDISESTQTINTNVSSELHDQEVNNYLSLIEIDKIGTMDEELGNRKGIAMVDDQPDENLNTENGDDKTVNSVRSIKSTNSHVESVIITNNKLSVNEDPTINNNLLTDSIVSVKQEELETEVKTNVVDDSVINIESRDFINESELAETNENIIQTEVVVTDDAPNSSSIVYEERLQDQPEQRLVSFSEDQDDYFSLRSMEIVKNSTETAPPQPFTDYVVENKFEVTNDDIEITEEDVLPKVISQIEKVPRNSDTKKRISFGETVLKEYQVNTETSLVSSRHLFKSNKNETKKKRAPIVNEIACFEGGKWVMKPSIGKSNNKVNESSLTLEPTVKLLIPSKNKLIVEDTDGRSDIFDLSPYSNNEGFVRLASRLGLSTDDFVNKILFDDSIHELTQELVDEDDFHEPQEKKAAISPEKKKSNVSFFPKNFFQQTTKIEDEDNLAIDLDLHQEKEIDKADMNLAITTIKKLVRTVEDIRDFKPPQGKLLNNDFNRLSKAVKEVVTTYSPNKTLTKTFEGLKSIKLSHPNNEVIPDGPLYHSQSESRIRQSLNKSIEKSKMEKQYSAPSLNDTDRQVIIDSLLKNLYEFGNEEDHNIAEALEILVGSKGTGEVNKDDEESSRIISDLPADRMLTVDIKEENKIDKFDDEARVLTANMKKRPSLAKAYEKSLERSNSLTSAEIIIDIANKIYINNTEMSQSTECASSNIDSIENYSLHENFPNLTTPSLHVLTPHLYNIDFYNTNHPSFSANDEIKYDRRPSSNIDEKIKQVKENKLKMDLPFDTRQLTELVSAKSQRYENSPNKVDSMIQFISKSDYDSNLTASPSRGLLPSRPTISLEEYFSEKSSLDKYDIELENNDNEFESKVNNTPSLLPEIKKLPTSPKPKSDLGFNILQESMEESEMFMEQELREILRLDKIKQIMATNYKQAVVEGLKKIHTNNNDNSSVTNTPFVTGNVNFKVNKKIKKNKNVFTNKLLPPLLITPSSMDVDTITSDNINEFTANTKFRGLNNVMRSKKIKPIIHPINNSTNSNTIVRSSSTKNKKFLSASVDILDLSRPVSGEVMRDEEVESLNIISTLTGNKDFSFNFSSGTDDIDSQDFEEMEEDSMTKLKTPITKITAEGINPKFKFTEVDI